jgi:Na+-driven multidrug efflux pump
MVMLPLASMVLVCLVNAWLDLGLGLGWWGMPEWGYLGVAWSTFWSVTGGLALNLILMRRAGLLYSGAWPPMRWVRRAWAYMFKVAWPSGLMQVLWHTGYLVVLAIVGGLPFGAVAALAGFATGARIESGVVLPAFAFNLSASIMVGHALGAGRPREAKRMGYRIWALGAGIMSLLTIGLWPCLAYLAGLFTTDAAVAAQTVSYLRYNLLAVPFTTTTMIMAGALTGAGATMYTMAIFGLAIWGVRLPVAWWLGIKVWGSADGVWLSMLVSQIFQALVLLAVFQFKNWAKFSMIKPRSLSV